MFTVIIAEKEHIEKIQQYRLFLNPFLTRKNVKFCPWRTDEEQLELAVPDLLSSIEGHEDWRAVIICGEQGLTQKNPFDLARFVMPERREDESERNYESRVELEKYAAYDAAAKQPLVRLTTHLCDWPEAESGINGADADPDFARYLRESAYKRTLREKIVQEQKVHFTKPAEVLCIAKRSYDGHAYDLRVNWTSHSDLQYSDFCDTNLYLDRLRFLTFDILPHDHQDYDYDYVRFLYTVLILAAEEMPSGALTANRVYRIDSEYDTQAMQRLLRGYDCKLEATAAMLQEQVNAIEEAPAEHLTDREVEQLFCASVVVPVTLGGDVDTESLYVGTHWPGLSGDCPGEERVRWAGDYSSSRHAMHQLLKQPRRSVSRAAAEMRSMSVVEEDRARLMNQYQLGDVQEFIDKTEQRMVTLELEHLNDMREYDEMSAKADRRVRKTIESRMKKRTTIALGGTVLAIFLLGLVPALVQNIGDITSRALSVGLTVGALVCMAAVTIGALFYLRSRLTGGLLGYNLTMGEIRRDVDKVLTTSSDYLSCACGVMRGYSVLNRFSDSISPETRQVRILKKHMSDINRRRCELRETFGQFLVEECDEAVAADSVYNYDFALVRDYTYPMPYHADMKRSIPFVQEGCTAEVPVDFVRQIMLRREELYD